MLSKDDIETFHQQGYLLVNNFINRDFAALVADRFPRIFRGEFETTVPPDEWRWAEGRDPQHVTRMIWNAWKSDRTIAQLSLSEKIGLYCAQLAGWDSTRLNQDGCLWKPSLANGLAFHQDGNYIQWVVPQEMITCWIALTDVNADTGTLEYVPGSHRWGKGERPVDFHEPNDYQSAVKLAAQKADKKLRVVPVNLLAGGAAFHHCWLWHGSGTNKSVHDQRVLTVHCMPGSAQFHPENPAFAQGRFKKFFDITMEESFYPILWSKKGQRSSFIETYLQGNHLSYRAHSFIDIKT